MTGLQQLKEMDDKNSMDEYTGTTIIGIQGSDFVLVATDKQVTGRYRKKRDIKSKKLYDKGVMAYAGLSADGQALIKNARTICKEYDINRGREISAEAFLNELQEEFRNDTYFCLSINGLYDREPILAECTFSGYCKRYGDYTSIGSGSDIASGYLKSQYESDMSVTQAREVAREALENVSEEGAFTGEGIDIAVIDEDGAKIERDAYEL